MFTECSSSRPPEATANSNPQRKNRIVYVGHCEGAQRLRQSSTAFNFLLFFPKLENTQAIDKSLNWQLRLPRQHAFGDTPLGRSLMRENSGGFSGCLEPDVVSESCRLTNPSKQYAIICSQHPCGTGNFYFPTLTFYFLYPCHYGPYQLVAFSQSSANSFRSAKST